MAVGVTCAAVASGARVLWHAPSKLLSSQHLSDLSLFKGLKVEAFFKATEKKPLPDADVYVGTNEALLDYGFLADKKIALIVQDEEHKSGVDIKEVRVKGQDRAAGASLSFARIMLSATPIPRTALMCHSPLLGKVSLKEGLNRSHVRTLRTGQSRSALRDLLAKALEN